MSFRALLYILLLLLSSPLAAEEINPPIFLTVNDALAWLASHPAYLLGYFLGLPGLAWFLSWITHSQRPQTKINNLAIYGANQSLNRRGERPPFNYIYAILVYLAAVPGIIAGLLLLYHLFFTQQNLLELNILVYFLPVLSALLTLPLIASQADFQHLPAVGRLSALMMLIALSVLLILFIIKTRIFIGFFGSVELLLLLGIGFFLLMKWAHSKLLGKS